MIADSRFALWLPIVPGHLEPSDRSLAWTVATLCALAAIAVGLWRLRRRLDGSTLIGPWAWSLAALAGIAVALLLPADSAYDAGRFAGLMGIFCPVMSLLGAKRPQDKAWHFIVASLWGILALPAIETLLLRPGQPLAIIDFRAWFLVILIGVNLLVYLPTRHAASALLLAAGQALLCWPYFPWTESSYDPRYAFAASLCFLAAFGLAHRLPARPNSYDAIWLDFRDTFGGLWGARVLERINASATMYGWPIRLGWNGFHDATHPAQMAEFSPELAVALEQNLTGLLRRFVSAQWLNARLPRER